MFSAKGAGAVIHTHSKHCVMLTLLYPGKEFRITHQEMIKGMKKGTTGINYRLVVLCIQEMVVLTLSI